MWGGRGAGGEHAQHHLKSGGEHAQRHQFLQDKRNNYYNYEILMVIDEYAQHHLGCVHARDFGSHGGRLPWANLCGGGECG